jgi:hypothetical protein
MFNQNYKDSKIRLLRTPMKMLLGLGLVYRDRGSYRRFVERVMSVVPLTRAQGLVSMRRSMSELNPSKVRRGNGLGFRVNTTDHKVRR